MKKLRSENLRADLLLPFLGGGGSTKRTNSATKKTMCMCEIGVTAAFGTHMSYYELFGEGAKNPNCAI